MGGHAAALQQGPGLVQPSAGRVGSGSTSRWGCGNSPDQDSCWQDHVFSVAYTDRCRRRWCWRTGGARCAAPLMAAWHPRSPSSSATSSVAPAAAPSAPASVRSVFIEFLDQCLLRPPSQIQLACNWSHVVCHTLVQPASTGLPQARQHKPWSALAFNPSLSVLPASTGAGGGAAGVRRRCTAASCAAGGGQRFIAYRHKAIKSNPG